MPEKLSSSGFILGHCKQESTGKEQLSFKCTRQTHTGSVACRKLTFWPCPQLFATSYFQQHPVKKQAQNTTGEAATRLFTFHCLGNCFKLWLGQMTTGKPRYFESAVHGQTSAWQTSALRTSNRSVSKGIYSAFRRGAANECLSTTSEFYWQQLCHSTVNIPQGVTVVITTLIITLIHFPTMTPLLSLQMVWNSFKQGNKTFIRTFNSAAAALGRGVKTHRVMTYRLPPCPLQEESVVSTLS